MALAAQWEKRTIVKEYFAIVAGVPDRDRDRIDQPIGMHPHQREKMAIRVGHATSREASTFYEVQERFAGFAALHVHPFTGRTHQIRVHLAHIGYPVLCDRIYGGRSQITLGELQRTDDETILLARQALHASRLRLSHPRTGAPLEFEAPLPADLVPLLEALRRWCARR
jgi:23S rRNA pseudouridine1911/1915/1917 synthase